MAVQIAVKKEGKWFIVCANDQEVDAYRSKKPALEAADKLRKSLKKG